MEGIKFGSCIGTDLGSLLENINSSNNGKIEGLLIGDSLGSTDVTVLGSDKGIKLGSTGDEALGTILGDVDRITLGIYVRTELAL